MTINGEAVPRTFIVYFIQRYRSVPTVAFGQ